ncbi:MAG: carboxypeptidase-like regulatory domain-containing protein, partial [Crocinitomicaceae bacterium]
MISFGQQTTIKGKVIDGMNKQPIPFAKIQFYDSKIGTMSDTLGQFFIQTYYATDSIKVSFSGYISKTVKIQKDQSQELLIELNILTGTLKEVRLVAPEEMPSTRLHKRVIANKPINNKEKLDAYEYELYNKIQLDLNNLDANFESNGLVKKLDVVLDFLDSNDRSGKYLPVVLSETVSDFYFKTNPKKKREVIKGTQITGIEN